MIGRVRQSYGWYVFGIREKNDKVWYCAERISNNDNILAHIKDNIMHMNLCKTKKEAEYYAKFWNECAIKNGNSIYTEKDLKFL